MPQAFVMPAFFWRHNKLVKPQWWKDAYHARSQQIAISQAGTFANIALIPQGAFWKELCNGLFCLCLALP